MVRKGSRVRVSFRASQKCSICRCFYCKIHSIEFSNWSVRRHHDHFMTNWTLKSPVSELVWPALAGLHPGIRSPFSVLMRFFDRLGLFLELRTPSVGQEWS
jgi:hypothetical protein